MQTLCLKVAIPQGAIIHSLFTVQKLWKMTVMLTYLGAVIQNFSGSKSFYCAAELEEDQEIPSWTVFWCPCERFLNKIIYWLLSFIVLLWRTLLFHDFSHRCPLWMTMNYELRGLLRCPTMVYFFFITFRNILRKHLYFIKNPTNYKKNYCFCSFSNSRYWSCRLT